MKTHPKTNPFDPAAARVSALDFKCPCSAQAVRAGFVFAIAFAVCIALLPHALAAPAAVTPPPQSGASVSPVSPSPAAAPSASPQGGAAIPACETPSSAAASLTPLDDASLKALTPGEARTLLRIVSLPPEKLVSLRDSVDALAKMTPQEKQVIRKKLETLRAGNAAPVGGAPPVPGAFPPPYRPRGDNPILRHWRTLSPEARKEEQARFQKMTPEERRAYANEISKKFPRRPAFNPPSHRSSRPAPPPPPPLPPPSAPPASPPPKPSAPAAPAS